MLQTAVIAVERIGVALDSPLAMLSGMRSLALLIAVAACAPRGPAPPAPTPLTPVAGVGPSLGCPTKGRLHGSVRDANSGATLSLATIVATGADGSRRVAISDDRGFYCIETEDVDVQVEVYFVDVAVLQQVHLGDEWPAAIDLLVDAYPASVEIETRYKDPDWCVIPVTPKIFDLSTR